MSRRKIKAGTTSLTVPIFIQDTSSTNGAGLGSLVYNSSGLAAKYRRQGDSTWTTITLATASVGTFTSGGFITDGGPLTGGYEIGIPNAAIQTGAQWCEVVLYGATNMLPVLLEFELDALDYQDSIRAGLTALPNASANANGGLPVLSSSGTALAYTLSTVTTVNGLAAGTITATSIAADAITAAKLASDVTTELQAGLATSSALAAVDSKVNTNAATLATLTGYVDTEIVSIKTVTDQLGTTLELDGSVYRFTSNALEQSPASSGSSTTIYVYPLTSTVPPSTIVSSGTTQGFQFTPLPVGPIAIFDANNTPIDLSAAVLQMILTRTTDPTDIVTLTSGNTELAVGGIGFNQVSIDYTPKFAGEYEWKLYRQEANPEDWTVLAIGFWNIEVGEDPG